MSDVGSATVVRLNGHEDGQLRQERERLATFGASMLSDREVLALAVGGGGAALPGGDAHLLAGRLLARFGTVRGVGRAHPGELAMVPGLGAERAARLAAGFELARRAEGDESPEVVKSPEDVVRVVRPLLAGQTRERLVVVICDRAGRVIGCELLALGSADRALLPIREVVVAVLRRDGQKFVLAHNHPSGDPTPSRDDIEGTQRVREAASVVGLRLLWHVVLGEKGWRVMQVLPASGHFVTGQDRRGAVQRTGRIPLGEADDDRARGAEHGRHHPGQLPIVDAHRHVDW